MSEYADGFDDGKGEKFDELMEEIVTLREKLKDCSAAFDRQQEMLDRNAEQIAALRDKLAKEQSEYICTCGIRVTPHKCPTNNGF